MPRNPPRPWFPFSLPELELCLALLGCVVTGLTLAGSDRFLIAASAIAFLVVAYLAGLLVYARKEALGFSLDRGGACGGRGYVDLVRRSSHSLLLMHVDDDTPVDELLAVYRSLLDRGIEQRRLIFLREDPKAGAYDWLEALGDHPKLDQRVVLPEQAEFMRLSFVVIDEETVVISLPGGSVVDSHTYARGLVFRDLLILHDSLVAEAFVEIHRQLWSQATPVSELRKLCNPVTLLAEVRCEIGKGD